MRERLIELIDQYTEGHLENICQPYGADGLADYLLENGVIVPPLKVGDTVYVVDKVRNGHWEECRYIIDDEGEWKIYEKDFNLVLYAEGDYYLTREEAEQELRKRDEQQKL